MGQLRSFDPSHSRRESGMCGMQGLHPSPFDAQTKNARSRPRRTCIFFSPSRSSWHATGYLEGMTTQAEADADTGGEKPSAGPFEEPAALRASMAAALAHRSDASESLSGSERRPPRPARAGIRGAAEPGCPGRCHRGEGCCTRAVPRRPAEPVRTVVVCSAGWGGQRPWRGQATRAGVPAARGSGARTGLGRCTGAAARNGSVQVPQQ